jgi:hypothetical protein
MKQRAFGVVFLGIQTTIMAAIDVHVDSIALNFASWAGIVHESKSILQKWNQIMMFTMEGIYLVLWCCLGLVTAGIIRKKYC